MTFVYIVRCRFTEPAKEEAWNAWYSGPKIEQMLRQPYFQTCQRFHRVSGTGRDYLALWTVETLEALNTRPYLSQWGFAEWSPMITDWSRDLFDGRPWPETAFAVKPGGALHVISFDGASADEAQAASAAPVQIGMMWLPVVGLDRHTPLIGLRPVDDLDAPPQLGDTAGTQQAVYRPVSALHTAGRSTA